MKPEPQNYMSLFTESYLRTVLGDQANFLGRFYDLFMSADPRVEQAFAGTDMDRQISMLQESLLYMIDFARAKLSTHRIEGLADSHGGEGLNIPSDLFDIWMNCLLEALKERDPHFDRHTETAWRVVLAPGLALMKSRCSSVI